MTALPAYYNYTSLQPFEEAFSTGWPILTYHKLGPRPRKVRLKGLYVSAPLFDHQLQELAMAGFQSRPLGGEHPCDSGRGKFITLTFDDGFENVLLHGLEPLQKHRFQAIQFLVPGLLGKENVWEQTEGETPERLMDDSQVREWLKAGHAIGAHSCTHPRLTQIPLAQAREEIRTSRMQLEDLFGIAVLDFCFPYGDFNDSIVDLVREAGFQTACTTASGVNSISGDRLRLRRLTARYASRNWRNLLGRLLGR